MLLADLVATADAVAATPKRSAKVTALVELLRRLDPAEVEPAVSMLTGTPRQGRVGVGWRTVAGTSVASAAEPSLTVGDLDASLSAVAGCAGPGSNLERASILERLLARSTAAEQSFVRRLLIGELRQGALEGVMTDAVARASGVPLPAVRRAVMLSGDLARTSCLALGADPDAALAAVRLEVGRPVLPMLATTSPDVATAIGEVGRASVEWKLDGIRIQVHRSGSDVRIFTRNLNDVTERLARVVDVVRALPARDLVLDGEAIGADARFFDVLHVDGADLLDEPLLARQRALDAVAGDHVIPRLVTDDPAAAASFADAAVDAGHEGVMVKATDSPYEAGRRGAAWRKVKPVRTLDLVVIAAEWGSGRRRGLLSNLHLTARADEGADGFVMVGKTFKGLTDELLRWQTDQLRSRQVSDDGIVVRVRPELVVEVAVDGVHRSTRYPGGVALRFARVRRYREDRSPADADAIADVRALLA